MTESIFRVQLKARIRLPVCLKGLQTFTTPGNQEHTLIYFKRNRNMERNVWIMSFENGKLVGPKLRPRFDYIQLSKNSIIAYEK